MANGRRWREGGGGSGYPAAQLAASRNGAPLPIRNRLMRGQ